MQVAVYNVTGMDWETAERVFYKGRGIAIAEPFFKIAADGPFVVRVDNPDDIERLRHSRGSS